MEKESQERKETTHVKIYTDKKERVAEIVRTKAYKEKKRVTEVGLIDEILERELPIYEKLLGI
jgi:hypothetical protein